jgi:hypothetical protein
MAQQSHDFARPKWAPWAGWSMTGLMIAFLLFDSVSKLVLEQHVVEATTRIGYPPDVIRPLGLICLACTILYAIPRTSILGAILLTGYLGGAMASKVRIEDPMFSSVLFGAYFGILVWGGLYLRAAAPGAHSTDPELIAATSQRSTRSSESTNVRFRARPGDARVFCLPRPSTCNKKSTSADAGTSSAAGGE